MKPKLFFGRPGRNYRKQQGHGNHVTITRQSAATLGRKTGVVEFGGLYPARTLADMGLEERAKLEREYGCRVSAERFEWGLI